jgi:hypothetical protein
MAYRGTLLLLLVVVHFKLLFREFLYVGITNTIKAEIAERDLFTHCYLRTPCCPLLEQYTIEACHENVLILSLTTFPLTDIQVRTIDSVVK